jgi:LuxR family quorum-sensing system transcriptional regulator SolR
MNCFNKPGFIDANMIYSTDLPNLRSHITLTSASTVTAMMLPKLAKHGIKVFHFNRHYEDGSCIRLSSDAKWNEHYFEKGYINKPKKVPAVYLSKPLGYFIWLTKDWPEMLTDAAVNFDIANGISIVEKCYGYVDNYCFGSTVSNTAIINFYLNNLDILLGYCYDFRDRASHLLHACEHNKIIIPQLHVPNNVGHPDYLPISIASLSTRERQCAMLLLSGKRIKEIAVELGLSARTIESYINNLKNKLNCRDKVALVIRLSAMFAMRL